MNVARVESYKSLKPQFNMNPTKFTLWLFLVTITMLFAAFTSALVVSRTDAVANHHWRSFDVPFQFTISTIAIVLSSISMQWAYYTASKNEISRNRIALLITFVLGIIFVYSQLLGYKALVAERIYLVAEKDAGGKAVSAISGSFFYLISGIHALHVVGGIFIIMATIFSAYRYRVHNRNMLRINLCTTYWHFIGGLWVYLFILLKVYC